MSKLSIIIPCYYNEGSIPELGQELLAEERNFPNGIEVEYIFIDDHSGDKTLEQLLNFKAIIPDRVKVIKLNRNVGSYSAMVLGLGYATGDCIAIMAADQQDPPSLLPEMYRGWQKGNGLVIAYRDKIEGQWFSKLFTRSFHLLMSLFIGSKTPLNGFDMVLFDRRVLDKTKDDPKAEVNFFYSLLQKEKKALKIGYRKRVRKHGRSMWTLSKKVKHLVKSLFYFFPVPIYRLLGAAKVDRKKIIDAVL